MKCSTERFNKDFLAKTPRPQRKIFSYFSELGVLCGSTLLTTLSPSKGAFARVIVYPIP
jgi:hypothetical protein